MDRRGSAASPWCRIVVAVLAVLGLGASAAGCGGDERDAVRERVERYVHEEQRVMGRAQPDFQRANETYVDYSKGQLEPETAAKRVADAERAIRNARDGVLVLQPPPEAQRLHGDLVRYLDLNVDLARQTTRLVRYVPAAAAALAPLGPANRRLQSRLAGAHDSAAQERILAGFAGAIGAVTTALRALRPPTVLQSTHVAQLRRLDTTRRLAERLQHALRVQDAEQVSLLLKRFRSTAPEPGVQRRLANQAVAHYREHVKRLGNAYQEVTRERNRLARMLG